MPAIAVRKSAPGFSLRDQAGRAHSLKDYLGHVVVLYFYPKDDTSACTAQACQFRDRLPDFRKVKAVVLGVSPDDPQSHKRFVEKHDLGFTLLADVPGADGVPRVCDDYGVWQRKSMFGRSYLGVVRTTYLLDPEGKVARRWDRVSVRGHVAQVLAAVKALHGGENLMGIDRRPKRLPSASRPKARARTGDSNPPYQPVRGPGTRRGSGPAARR